MTASKTFCNKPYILKVGMPDRKDAAGEGWATPTPPWQMPGLQGGHYVKHCC